MEEPAWDANLGYIGSHEHIYAIGMFALCYNELEMALYVFFQHYFSKNEDARHHLFASLHNRERVDLIKLLANQESEAEREAVAHAMKCFDICAENRNLLLHSVGAGLDGEKMVVMKRAPKELGAMNQYAFSVDDIRSTAVTTNEVTDYLFELGTYLRDRDSAAPMTLGTFAPPLPRRPLQPRKLNLSRHLIDPEDV